MGWLTMHRPKGKTNQEYFEGEFSSVTFLDSATVDNVFYAACAKKDVPDEWPGREVFAVVCLLSWSPNSHHNFGYKDMDETMGPVEHKCPDRILDLLTPTESEYAVEWRAKCRAYNAAKAAKPKVKKGDMVRFAQPLKFTDGSTLDTLEFEARNTFRAHGRRYSLGRWREREYSLA